MSNTNPYGSLRQSSQPQARQNSFVREDSFSSSQFLMGSDGVTQRSPPTPNVSQSPKANYLPSFLMNAAQGQPATSYNTEFATPNKRASGWSSPQKPASGGATRDLYESRSMSAYSNNEDVPPSESIYDMEASPQGPRDNGFYSGAAATRPSAMSASTSASSVPRENEFSHTTRLDQDRSMQLTSNSVVVFGFPPSATSLILSQFRSYGDVTSYEMSPSGGNWMTITYTSRWQAHRALAKNGKIFNNSVMIGVVPVAQDLNSGTNGEVVADMNSSINGYNTPPPVQSVTEDRNRMTMLSGSTIASQRVAQDIPSASLLDTSTSTMRRGNGAPGLNVKQATDLPSAQPQSQSEGAKSENNTWGKALDVIFGW
ncbi:MPPN-domain-containing protein [Basidiobolus meristosporus CBS 931.73]|uniref:MPPN-domain-containing protein n=1 Tax=Basidiobolus meristosporus CBS 931.73 TaxID=1314790 RepID=A0A1Y1XJW6_9FUNG|nr:MPPN-domain-containing protein [Basidiobolus meristosporus CBS 931.73]|eukprot:ORX86015.1 MPPN-domain-containing protein [Basidiobolus meristosporus CBS 931.73]